MAGGVGSRFWPMSTPEYPKQFIDVLGVGKSLLQLTVERFKSIIPCENIWIVTSKQYKNLVLEQIPGLDLNHLLLEPCMRNTAPCIAYVSNKIKEKYPQANLVFSPADHIVLDGEEFRRVIQLALDFTAKNDIVVTLGMNPTRPETGYGYIKSVIGTESIRKVEAFREKPDLKTAERYLAEGNYYWNSGIFVWNVQTVILELQRYVPELAERFEKLKSIYYTDQEQQIIDKEFPLCEKISIDYAVMEKSDNISVYPASFGWSDLGTWGSLYSILKKDENDNTVVGENINLVECHNCIVHVPETKKIIIEGLNNYIIAEKNQSLLICKKEHEQLIKDWY